MKEDRALALPSPPYVWNGGTTAIWRSTSGSPSRQRTTLVVEPLCFVDVPADSGAELACRISGRHILQAEVLTHVSRQTGCWSPGCAASAALAAKDVEVAIDSAQERVGGQCRRIVHAADGLQTAFTLRSISRHIIRFAAVRITPSGCSIKFALKA